MTKTIKSRISQKHDIEANWLLVPDFIPLNGEIIIYDEDENLIDVTDDVFDE